MNDALSIQTIKMIEWMRSHGSSLIINWSEDSEPLWEVAWITSGKRYVGFSDSLHFAILRAAKSFGAEAEKDILAYLNGSCEHGVIEGEWCADCSWERKRAKRENGDDD